MACLGSAIRRGLVGLLLVLLALAAGGHGALAQETPAGRLNLSDVEIRTFIDTVAKVTGKNFIVDPRVKARITVITPRELDKDELYQVFLSVLDVHGFAAVPVGGVIKILPDVNAKQGPVPTTTDREPGTGDELVTRVIDVRNVPAAQLVPILRPLVPQQGHLAAYPSTNVLVISDRAANIERLAQLIRRIDRADNEEIEVIQLQHAAAPEVVRILTQLLQASAGQAGGQLPGTPVMTADERTNSVLLGGDKPARLRLRAIIAHLDTPLDSSGETEVVFLKYANAKDMVTVLQGTSQSQQQAGQQKAPTGGGNVEIQADETNNALIITAPAAVRRNLLAVIRQLDIPRAQVLVEAVIAEISTDLSRDLGVAWAVNGTSGNDQGPVGVGNFGGLADTIAGIAQGQASFGVGMLLGVGDLRDGRTNWAVVLRALAGDAATNILSTPTLVTMDNEEAEIVVGQNVPFLTGSYTTTGTTGSVNNPFQTIQRQDVGLTLKVKPQVNEGNNVRLEIQQEVSSIASSAQSASDLITNKRSIKTNVMVEDNQVLVLGGLMEDRFRDRQEKVPLLGDIPLLGRLFRYDTTQKEKTNLMVFIHPVIIRDTALADHYTHSKYSYLRARQIDAGIEDRGLIRDEAARLPALEELITPPPATGAPAAPAVPDAPTSPAPAPSSGALAPAAVEEPPAAAPEPAAAGGTSTAPEMTATTHEPTEQFPRIAGIEPTPQAQTPATPAPTASAKTYTLQLAAGANPEELQALASRYGSDALPMTVLRNAPDGGEWYVLVAGDFPDIAAARRAERSLPSALKTRGAWIRPVTDLAAAQPLGNATP